MDTDVVHGDVKPQNVLVFEDATGKTIVKMTDIGYSTLAAGKVLLPKSRPWNAPKHHFGEFKVSGDCCRPEGSVQRCVCTHLHLYSYIYGLVALLDNIQLSFSSITI
jgi:serine/threonine protein kinase